MRKTITALATAGVLAVAGGVAAAEIGGVGPFASSNSTQLESTGVVAVDVMPGEHTFAVAEAGTVTVIATATSLEVAGVEAAAGWTSEIEVAAGNEVEVKFDKPGHDVDFTAELEDGRLKVKVRERSDLGVESTTTTTVALGSGSETSIRLTGSAAGELQIGESQTFTVDEAGTVTIEMTADGLAIVTVDAADGWTSEIEMEFGTEVEVDFRSGATRTSFEAELDDGAIKIDIETETRSSDDGSDDDDSGDVGDSDDDDDDSGDDDESTSPLDDGATATFSAGAAGTVTLQRNGNTLEVVSVDALPGWTFTVDAEGDGEVDIDFMSLTGEVEFSAEVEDGRIEIDVEVELDGDLDD